MNRKFEIRNINEIKGKGLFATQEIKSGEIIFTEKPLISSQFSWNALYGYRACDHCIRPLETAQENVRRLAADPTIVLPYPELCQTPQSTCICENCGVSYCTQECAMEAAQQYHTIICSQELKHGNNKGLSELLEIWRTMYYPPETCSIMLIVRLFALVAQCENRDHLLNVLMQFCHKSSIDGLEHRLLAADFESNLEVLREKLPAVVPTSEVQHWLTYDGFRSLIAMIGTNGQGIGTSALSAWYKTCEHVLAAAPESEQADFKTFVDIIYDKIDEQSGDFLDNEGSGLYYLQSSCNHSCDPNAECVFVYNNFELSLRAVRDISINDEISITYVSECVIGRSRHTRRKELLAYYLFHCTCPKCQLQEGDPDVTSDESDAESDG